MVPVNIRLHGLLMKMVKVSTTRTRKTEKLKVMSSRKIHVTIYLKGMIIMMTRMRWRT